MAVTLAQAKLNAADDIQVGVIDEFRKSSWLLDNLIFDDVVNPAGGGASLVYGYKRLITQPTAAFRAVNNEYVAQEVTKQAYTVELKPFGGSFEIDRLLAKVGPQAASEVNLQLSQKVKAAQALFGDAVINGDVGVDANAFDGLDVALTGSTTELGVGESVDWSGIATEAAAFTAMDQLDNFLSLLDGEPTAILANAKTLAKIRGVARRAGYFTKDRNEFGQAVERYGNIVLVDPGNKPGTNDAIIPIETRDPANSKYTITITGSPTGGNYTLTVNGVATGNIAHNANAAAIKAAIVALDAFATDDVDVTGTGPFTVEFEGDYIDQYVTLTSTATGLTGGSNPDAAVAAVTGTTAVTGLTDIYAVRLGLDGFHAVSLAGTPLVQAWPPDFTSAGAVKKGEVEMVAAVALKATKAAAVYRNIKVQ